MFDESVLDAAQADAVAAYPNESCGLVLDLDGACRYLACENRSARPADAFEIDPALFLDHAGRIRAVIHSHPDGPDYPTAEDMAGQIATAVPWGIVVASAGHAEEPFFWGDGVPVRPLAGRTFRHGVADCYSLVRDAFLLKRGIVLPEIPRTWEWWLSENGAADLYRRNLAAAGFVEIGFADLRPGDGVLMAIRSRQPNHAALVLDGGRILHHLPGRISGEDVLYRWKRFITHCLRHAPGGAG